MVDRRPRPADNDCAKAQQRHSLAWRLAVAGVGLLAVGVLVVSLLACVRWIPERMYPSLTDTDLRGVSDASKVEELKGARLKLQNDARTTLLQGLGALLVLTGAAVGASVTLRQVQATRDQITETATASRNQLDLSEQGQVTDRYTKAIDQLDDKKALAVRLGGLYALERIAHDSLDDRATIAEVLCAYARTSPRPKLPVGRAKDADPPVAEATSVETPAAELPSLTVRAPDVQAALTILGRWRERLGEPPPVLDLHGADLQGASLVGAQLESASLMDAQLQGASLIGAQLQAARFVDAQLHDGVLRRAQLQRADLRRAQLQRADLRRAQLQEAILIDAKLQDASLHGAQLQDASLHGAQLQGTWASQETRWPEGWDQTRARAAGVRFVEP